MSPINAAEQSELLCLALGDSPQYEVDWISFKLIFLIPDLIFFMANFSFPACCLGTGFMGIVSSEEWEMLYFRLSSEGEE